MARRQKRTTNGKSKSRPLNLKRVTVSELVKNPELGHRFSRARDLFYHSHFDNYDGDGIKKAIHFAVAQALDELKLTQEDFAQAVMGNDVRRLTVVAKTAKQIFQPSKPSILASHTNRFVRDFVPS